MIIVNGFQPLTIILKRSILDVAAALDPPLSLTSQTESTILDEHEERDDDNISIIIENKLHAYFEATERWSTQIEDHLIGLSNLKSTTGNVPHDNFYTDLLKKPNF